jgi:hypothetical protein
MLTPLLVSSLLIVITTALHGGCTAVVLRVLPELHLRSHAAQSLATKVAVIAALVMLMLTVSLAEAWVWSLAYLAVGAIEGTEPALYFSIVTFTTLG